MKTAIYKTRSCNFRNPMLWVKHDGGSGMIELQLSKAFQLIEPGPVVLLTTAHNHKANIMTMSWHMVMDFTPQNGTFKVNGRTLNLRKKMNKWQSLI